MKIPNINIGEILKTYLYNQRISNTEFAYKLHIQPPAIHHMLKKSEINTARLKQISEALDHNFFKYYIPEMADEPELAQLKTTLQNTENQLKLMQQENAHLTTQLQHAQKEIDYLKQIIDLKKS